MTSARKTRNASVLLLDTAPAEPKVIEKYAPGFVVSVILGSSG